MSAPRRSGPHEYATDEIVVEWHPALCRCGQSKNKPFCDGTHREIGFRG